jgi:replication factor A2
LKEPLSPIGRMQSGLAVSLVTPSPKEGNKGGKGFINEEPFINERKPSSTTVGKSNLNNGEHMLIPVTAKMIHSAVYECKRLILKDGRPLHMVKFVGAVKNYSENTKNVIINVEDGTGLVRVILWQKQNECMAARELIHKCNGNGYICVIGEAEDYYGVHKIIAFDVCPITSGNEVTHHFLEVAYSFEKTLEYAEDEMLRAVPLK